MVGTFGAGTSFTHPTPAGPWGLSPYGTQGLNINPFALQQFYGHPFGSFASVPAFGNAYGAPPLQQAVQHLLQLLPQQLQQLEYLEHQQLQHLQQVQQLVQLIPHQLAQLQQLIQSGPRQIQPTQPFGQIPGLGSSIAPWGIQPQAFGTQPGQVM